MEIWNVILCVWQELYCLGFCSSGKWLMETAHSIILPLFTWTNAWTRNECCVVTVPFEHMPGQFNSFSQVHFYRYIYYVTLSFNNTINSGFFLGENEGCDTIIIIIYSTFLMIKFYECVALKNFWHSWDGRSRKSLCACSACLVLWWNAREFSSECLPEPSVNIVSSHVENKEMSLFCCALVYK